MVGRNLYDPNDLTVQSVNELGEIATLQPPTSRPAIAPAVAVQDPGVLPEAEKTRPGIGARPASRHAALRTSGRGLDRAAFTG
jgi:hypothetical protein